VLRRKPSGKVARTAADQLDSGLDGWRSRPGWDHEEPGRNASTRIGPGQIANEALATQVGRHRRVTPGLDVPRTHSANVQNAIATMPIPRLVGLAATDRATSGTQVAGLDALVSLSRPVPDVPAPPPLAARADSVGQVVALIPAHNEEASIGATVESLLMQTRVPDRIVVIPNNCDDRTAEVASAYPITVLEIKHNQHGKSSALNLGWQCYARDAFMVVCIDADTVMPPNAVADWLAEMEADVRLGGSSSKFTMLGNDWLTRLQRSEFARWSQTSLQRGHTSVLAGTGCAIRGEALRAVVARHDRDGPWSYNSTVEDFELTFRIRQRGWRCRVSPTVPAYTDSMKTIHALWAQRMKWQVGTVQDLLTFGFSRLTLRDWVQQGLGLLSALVRGIWIILWTVGASTGWLHPNWTWWAFPALFAVMDLATSLKIPGRDWVDVLMGALLLPNELFAWLRAGWFIASWSLVLSGRDNSKDLWAAQYAAEAALTS